MAASNNQMTSDNLKLVEIISVFLDFSNLYTTVTQKNKILGCGNDANCLGVLAGFSRNFHFYKTYQSDLTIWGLSHLSHAIKDLNILESWSFFTIFVCIEHETLKISESFVLTEPQDIVIFWFSWNFQV